MTNNSATFDGTNLMLDGAIVMEVQEFEENKNETIITPAGVTRYNDPAFGVPSDYTVYQGVTNRSIKFENLSQKNERQHVLMENGDI